MHSLLPAHNAGIRYKLLMYFCFLILRNNRNVFVTMVVLREFDHMTSVYGWRLPLRYV